MYNMKGGIEELFPRKGRDSPTFNEQQVPCCNMNDSSANSVLKDRDSRSSSRSKECINLIIMLIMPPRDHVNPDF